MAYFDTDTSRDFTMRVHYDNSTPGYITIQKVQLQSKTYNNKWFPKGTIKINGETVLNMDYANPATHVINVGTPGETWYDMTVANPNGIPLPVSNPTKITASSVRVEISVQLYRDGSSPTPNLTGAETVYMSAGLVYIANGSKFEAYEVWIANGSKFERYEPYVADGSKFVLCS
jgi:hypothetical protein